MVELSDGALKILRKCRELGFDKEGEAIQGKSYSTEFDSIADAKDAHTELVEAGMCAPSKTRSVKLTAEGARAAKTA